MKILLVGATGTLGRQIAKQAIEDGHEVRCFVRNPRKASFLQEWGCELTKGNLLNSTDIEYALQDIEIVIDAATSRPDDPKSIYEIDWDGKLNLFNACESLNVKRVIFLSILLTEKFRNVPLMDVKFCTEKLLEKSDLDYTIFKCAAFMQGVIGQFAIPILDSQAVWMSGTPTKIAFQFVLSPVVLNLQILLNLKNMRHNSFSRNILYCSSNVFDWRQIRAEI